jgi:hypothetical protein
MTTIKNKNRRFLGGLTALIPALAGVVASGNASAAGGTPAAISSGDSTPIGQGVPDFVIAPAGASVNQPMQQHDSHSSHESHSSHDSHSSHSSHYSSS